MLSRSPNVKHLEQTRLYLRVALERDEEEAEREEAEAVSNLEQAANSKSFPN